MARVFAMSMLLASAAWAGGGEPPMPPQQHIYVEPPDFTQELEPLPPIPPTAAHEQPALDVSITIGSLPWAEIAVGLGFTGGGAMWFRERRRNGKRQ